MSLNIYSFGASLSLKLVHLSAASHSSLPDSTAIYTQLILSRTSISSCHVPIRWAVSACRFRTVACFGDLFFRCVSFYGLHPRGGQFSPDEPLDTAPGRNSGVLYVSASRRSRMVHWHRCTGSSLVWGRMCACSWCSPSLVGAQSVCLSTTGARRGGVVRFVSLWFVSESARLVSEGSQSTGGEGRFPSDSGHWEKPWCRAPSHGRPERVRMG